MTAKMQRRRSQPELHPEFGEWLRRARTNKGFNATEFSQASGVHDELLRNLERGDRVSERQLTLGMFGAIADALDLELGYLLHKAGFDLGADGIKLARLKRVEQVAEATARAEHQVRAAVSQAIAAFEGDPAKLMPEDVKQVVLDLGRALAAVDLLAERLREQGFGTDRFHRVAFKHGERRPWTPEEEEWLRSNPQISHEDAARTLSRSLDAIRSRRIAFTKANNGGKEGS